MEHDNVETTVEEKLEESPAFSKNLLTFQILILILLSLAVVLGPAIVAYNR